MQILYILLTARNMLQRQLLGNENFLRLAQICPSNHSTPLHLVSVLSLNRDGKIMAGKGFTNGMKHFHGKLESLASARLNYDAKFCFDSHSHRCPSSTSNSKLSLLHPLCESLEMLSHSLLHSVLKKSFENSCKRNTMPATGWCRSPKWLSQL